MKTKLIASLFVFTFLTFSCQKNNKKSEKKESKKEMKETKKPQK